MNVKKSLILSAIVAISIGLYVSNSNPVQAACQWTCCESGNPNNCTGWQGTETCSYNSADCTGKTRCPSSKPDSIKACDSDSCTDSNPAAVSLQSPSNNVTVPTTNVTLKWNETSNWGKCCDGTHRHYYVYYRKKVNNCSLSQETDSNGTYRYTDNKIEVANNVTQRNINVTPGNTYCWYVQTWNKCVSRDSSKRQFTVAGAANHIDTSINAPVCNSGYSGTSDQSSTDNPITITSTYTHPNGIDNIDQVSLAIIPNTIRNAMLISENNGMNAARNYFMGTVNINHANTSNSTFYIVNNSSGTGVYSSNIQNNNLVNNTGRSILLDINGTTANSTKVEVVNANTLKVYWRVQFTNTYPLTPTNNLYTAAFTQLPNGNWLSSAYQSGYSRYLGKESGKTWGVDVNPPTVNAPAPDVQDSTKFSIDWSQTAKDNNQITNMKAYMWPTKDPLNLSKTNSPTTTFNLTTTEPIDFTASNININETNYQTTNTFEISSNIDPTEELNTKVVAKDIACNISSVTNDIGLSKSWMITVGGDTYNTNTKVNALNVNLNPPFTDLTNQDSFFSTYLNAIKEATRSLSTRISKYTQILNGYDDWNAKPPRLTNKDNWYDYLHELVSKNTGTIANSTFQGQAGANNGLPSQIKVSSALGVNPYEKKHVEINGDLSIPEGTICDTQSIIFIDGNLTINPTLEIENAPDGTQMGCMFVVNGNVTIEKGEYANQGNSASPVEYDTVKGFFIVNGDFSVLPNDSNQIDAMYIKGGVIADQANFERNLHLLDNANQPSELIRFDARYSNIFREDLRSVRFSIREKNFIEKVTR